MLQQTQVKTVIPYYTRWMKALPDVQALAKASPQRLHKLWEGLGYYTRVRNMRRAARQMIADHGGSFPNDFDAILALPGIGRYTAGAICSIAFNQARPILDGNVIRVLCRVFGIGTDPREKKTNATLWQLAEAIVQQAETPGSNRGSRREEALNSKFRNRNSNSSVKQRSCSALNQSLMELGALLCLPRLPRCEICPINSACHTFTNRLTDILPVPSARQEATPQYFVAYVARRNGSYFVRQRPPGVVNSHLWEFPNTTSGPSATFSQSRAGKCLGFACRNPRPLPAIRHSITRYRITLNAFLCDAPEDAPEVSPSGKWVSRAGLAKLPFTSAHRKLINTLFDSERMTAAIPRRKPASHHKR